MVNNYIGADFTSQTRFDFHCYNSHPYQRTIGIIKKCLTYPFFLHHVKDIVGVSMNACKRVYIIPHLCEHKIEEKQYRMCTF